MSHDSPDLISVGGRDRTISAHAHLTILSERVAPDELAERIGIVPDRAWSKGDVNVDLLRHQRFNGLVYESRLERDRGDVQEHLNELVGRLEVHASQIRQLVGSAEVESARLWIVEQTASSNFGIHIPPELIASISALGVSLELDIYSLRPD